MSAWTTHVEFTDGLRANVCVEEFDTFTNYNVAFGEVRNIWDNHTPLGEHGLVHATLGFEWRLVSPLVASPTKSLLGSAIPGFYLNGHTYRVGALKGQSRTSIGLDIYLTSYNILMYLLSFRLKLHGTVGSTGDLAQGLWNSGRPGWGVEE